VGTFLQRFSFNRVFNVAMVFAHEVPQPFWNGSMITIEWGGKPRPNHLKLVSSSLAVTTRGSPEHALPDPPHDWKFLLVYWGVLAIGFAVHSIIMYFKEEEEKKKTRRTSLVTEVEGEEVTQDLPDSTYALPIACALGLVQRPNGQILPLWVASIFAFCCTAIQTYTVILFYDAIDKSARPITTMGTAEGHLKPFATNQMKLVMTVFLCLFSLEDSQQFLKVLRQTLIAHPSEFHKNKKSQDSEGGTVEPDQLHDLHPQLRMRMSFKEQTVSLVNPPIRVFLLLFPAAQFFCLLQASSVGVCALMSEQSVLTVISDAVSICFVTQLDDMMWKFASAAFGLKSDLTVKLHKGSLMGFEPSTEALLRSSVWFPLALMWFFLLYGMRTNHLPEFPNPLVALGVSG